MGVAWPAFRFFPPMASGWDFPNLLFHEGYPSGNDEHFSMENHLIEMS